MNRTQMHSAYTDRTDQHRFLTFNFICDYQYNQCHPRSILIIEHRCILHTQIERICTDFLITRIKSTPRNLA